MGALPGEHLCTKHQGNHSHYDEKNCRVCTLERELADAQRVIAAIVYNAGGSAAVPYSALMHDYTLDRLDWGASGFYLTARRKSTVTAAKEEA